MKKDDIEKLKAKRKYLSDWLERNRKAQEVVPYVHMNLELTEWEIQSLSDLPDEADEIPMPGLSAQISRDYKYLTSALPMMPEYKVSSVYNSTAVTTSGSATVYEAISRVSDIDTPVAKNYSQLHLEKYHQLQEAQSRANDVRNLISNFGNQQTLERFDKADKSYSLFKAGTLPRTSAAAEMRTLLDGIKGDLFAKARRWPKENMTWKKMAERLTKSDIEKDELIAQKKKRASLISRLSDVLKERESGSVTNLEYIWTQVLDHIFVVLNLVS